MNEKLRIIPEYLSNVIRGLCGTQIIEAPAVAIGIVPEITHPITLKHYRTRRGVCHSLVVDLLETGEGPRSTGSKPVDADKLLEEIKWLAGCAQGALVKNPRYR